MTARHAPKFIVAAVIAVIGVIVVPLLLLAPQPSQMCAAIDAHNHGTAVAQQGAVAVASGQDPRVPAGTLGAEAIAQLAIDAGWRAADVPIAVAVALAESAGDPSATNTNTNGSTDYGLWQINDVHRESGFQPHRAFRPDYNAAQAYAVWQRSGGRWTPWVTYNKGLHLRHMPAAERAAGNMPAAVTPAGYGRPIGVPVHDADLADIRALCDDHGQPPAAQLVSGGAGRPGAGEFPPANAAPWSALRDRSLYGEGTGGASINMLDPRFARQLAELEKSAGARLQISSGYRTAGYQAELCQRVSGPCAPPGRSLHQQGLAVDLSNWAAYEPYETAHSLCSTVPSDQVHTSANWGPRPCA